MLLLIYIGYQQFVAMNTWSQKQNKKLSYRRECAHLTSLSYLTVQKTIQYVELFRRGSGV